VSDTQGEEDRRNFLRSCGRLAVTVPPAMTVLLSTSLTTDAIAKSTSGGGGGDKPGRGPDKPGKGRGRGSDKPGKGPKPKG